MSIPDFFKMFFSNHLNDFIPIDNTLNNSTFVSLENIDQSNEKNIKSYYIMALMHQLFTSHNASNGSRGEILNIPYYWHWVSPNPRHSIYLAGSKQLLSELKPPAEFSKYASFADIDRTPFLYLSELFLPKQKYNSKTCDTFSTFGWCSEREMAFVCIMELLGYTGQVIAEGNHSWSEFIIPLISKNGKTVNYLAKVDNTFNSLELTEIESHTLDAWKTFAFTPKQVIWYRQKAHSETEKQKIREFVASTRAMARIESSFVKFLQRSK